MTGILNWPATQLALTDAKGSAKTARTVVSCYDFLDRVFPECGFRDLTEGIYHGNRALDYEQAQDNQARWILDRVHCEQGTRLLDIGCGYGRLLEQSGERGAKGIGITVSPPQVAHCRCRGLDVRLVDYRAAPRSWWGSFDAIVANGSLEHFVCPHDAVAGRSGIIYQQFFEMCGRLLKRTPAARLVTTSIQQFAGSPRVARDAILKPPWAFRRNTPEFHCALLQQTFGGYYPAEGELQRTAQEWFRIAEEEDGTDDYRLTSETWFARVRECFRSWRHGPRLARRLASYLLRHPYHGLAMCWCLFVSESWQWQFRGPHPPVRLLRQVWEPIPR